MLDTGESSNFELVPVLRRHDIWIPAFAGMTILKLLSPITTLSLMKESNVLKWMVLSDSRYPNERGHQVIAEAVMKWLGNVFDHPSFSSFNPQPINFDKNTIIPSVINGVIPSEK